MKQPLIGITADREDPGGYSKFPWYALRVNYCSAVTAAGGLPLILPADVSLVDQYADLIDGLIVSGGAFDVDPALFGEQTKHDTVVLKADRTDFELGLTKRFLEQDRPVFGICGGQQLLAVALGGTLIQHLPDEVENALAHEQPNPRDEAGHEVRIAIGSRLHDIVKAETLAVNSAHHQAVKTVPESVVINALASDGVIEGIEDPTKRWCLGVQWHPEFHISEGDKRLYDSFIQACT
ncbi:MAG: gamma-glutamyl-gamma-aminobutyrate hydrolase family protein [Rhodospirillaceae bacterium]|jgi:putative glutamine amidotransferase